MSIKQFVQQAAVVTAVLAAFSAPVSAHPGAETVAAAHPVEQGSPFESLSRGGLGGQGTARAAERTVVAGDVSPFDGVIRGGVGGQGTARAAERTVVAGDASPFDGVIRGGVGGQGTARSVVLPA